MPDITQNQYSTEAPSKGERGSAVSLWTLMSAAAVAAGTYHGYRRSKGSLGWTLGWAAFSAIIPVIAIPIAVAQGYAKPKQR